MARTRVGLDIGSTGVRAAELAAGTTPTLLRAAQVPLPQGAVENGEVRQPQVVGEALHELWQRGGFVVLGFLILIAIGGVTDVGYLLLTGGMGCGLIVSGILAGEVAEEMRNREVWAFVVGIVISIVAVVSSVLAVNVLAPGLFDPTAVRWLSAIVFGGAGLAAAAGLVLLFLRREA